MSDETPIYQSTARAYDLLHRSDDAANALEAVTIESIVREHVPGASSLLDVACGTGVHLAALRQNFASVAGVDASAEMLMEARPRLPDTKLVQADMRSFFLDERFDAVTCLFSSIGYLTTKRDLDGAVVNMKRHLGTPGVLVIEGWVLPEDWTDGRLPRSRTASDEELCVARIDASHRSGNITTLDMHWLLGDRLGVRHLREVHRLRLWGRADYLGALERAGLEVSETSGLTGRGLYVGVRR